MVENLTKSSESWKISTEVIRYEVAPTEMLKWWLLTWCLLYISLNGRCPKNWVEVGSNHGSCNHFTNTWYPKQPVLNGCKWWNNHFLNKDLVHHPIETTVYKQMAIRFQAVIKSIQAVSRLQLYWDWNGEFSWREFPAAKICIPTIYSAYPKKKHHFFQPTKNRPFQETSSKNLSLSMSNIPPTQEKKGISL